MLVWISVLGRRFRVGRGEVLSFSREKGFWGRVGLVELFIVVAVLAVFFGVGGFIEIDRLASGRLFFIESGRVVLE